jgi:hypothetical protein
MLQIQEATQDQVKRYQYDLYITLFQARFTYYTFDVEEAWRTGIRQWFEGRHSPLVDILGPIKDALSWFWNNILKPPLEAMFRGLGWIADKAISGISVLLQPINNFFLWIYEKVSGLGEWIWSQVSAGLESLWSRFSGAISAVGSALSSAKDAFLGALSSAASALHGALEGIYSGMAAMMSRVSEYIVSGLSGAFQIFREIGEWIWEGIKRVIVDPIKAGVEALLNAIRGAAESITGMIREAIEPKSPAAIEGTFKRVLGVITGVTGAVITTEIGIHLANAAHPMKNLELRQTRDMLIHVAGFHALLSSFQQVYFRASVEIPLQYELNKLWTPRIPDERTTLEMLSRYRISRERAHELMRYHGYGPEWDEWWDELANTPLTFTMLRYAATGGTLDESWVEEELKRRGYSERAVSQLKRAIRFLADSQDIKDCQTIIRSLVKEGFFDKNQARAAFQAFKTLDDPLERQLFIADLYYLYDFRTDQRDYVLTKLKKGKLDKDGTLRELEPVVVVPERRETLVDKTLAALKLAV